MNKKGLSFVWGLLAWIILFFFAFSCGDNREGQIKADHPKENVGNDSHDSCDGDGDGYTKYECGGSDCDDGNSAAHPEAEELCDGMDTDCSGEPESDEIDEDGDGFMLCDSDCNDNDPRVYPGAKEVCDSLDNDCDGTVPENEYDYDGDGFRICAGDCDDLNPEVHPGAFEVCDGGIDNNCDAELYPGEIDEDQDGFMICDGDCNDDAPSIHPDALEVCDGVDQDCDGTPGMDEVDLDNDGFMICQGDCNDNSREIYPGANERCNAEDDSCDGVIPENELDSDGDDYSPCEGDCKDTDSQIYPGAPERCNSLDDSCDGVVPENEADEDQDGFMICEDDCNDLDSQMYPGAPERCNAEDDSCDGVIPENEADQDQDGFMICEDDCDDSDSQTYPGAPERCNAEDDSCDGVVPEDETDQDQDGFMACMECDDSNPNVHPNAVELCHDGIDNNCDGLWDVSPNAWDPACALPSDNVHVLTDEVMEGALVENGSVVFPSGHPEIENLQLGDIIASGYENGLLRTVTNISQGQDQVTLTTDQASLEDSFEILDYTVELPLIGPGADSKTSAPWIDIDYSGEVLIDEPVNGGHLTVLLSKANLTFSPILYSELRIGLLGLEKFEFRIGGEASLEVEVSADWTSEMTISRERTIPLPQAFQPLPITVPVGPVPVVIVPRLELVVGIEVVSNQYASIVTGASGTAGVAGGILFENNQWQPIVPVPFAEVELLGPDIETEANVGLRGYVRLQMAFLLYDVAGPYVGIEPYASADLELLPTCEWEVGLGLDAFVGAEVQVLGYTIYDTQPIDFLTYYERLTGGACSAPYYCDHDGDGYISMSTSGYYINLGGNPPPGCRVTPGTDCDDRFPYVYPGNTEICDSYDNDCDGLIDEGGVCEQSVYYCDQDGDGYLSDTPFGTCNGSGCVPGGCSVSSGSDCNDQAPYINPGQTEDCFNGFDDNCDDIIDCNVTPYYCDYDYDGYYSEDPYGDCTGQSCPPAHCRFSVGEDCDDGNSNRNPGQTEICNNGIDDNCNDIQNEGCTQSFTVNLDVYRSAHASNDYCGLVDNEIRLGQDWLGVCPLRSYVAFNLSSIPDNAIITKVELHLYCSTPTWETNLVNVFARHYMISHVGSQAPTVVFADAGDGTYYTNIGSNPIGSVGWTTMVLNSNGRADLHNSLPSDQFAIGLHDLDDNAAYGIIEGYLSYYRPRLVVDYEDR